MNDKFSQMNDKFSQMNDKNLQTIDKNSQMNDKKPQMNEKQKNRKLLKTPQIKKQDQIDKIAIFIKKTRARHHKNSRHTINNINKVKLFIRVAIQIGKKHKKTVVIILYNTTLYINIT